MNYHPNNHDTAIAAFHDFIHDQHFPCVAAKSALATEGMRLVVGGDLRDRQGDVLFLPAFHGTPDETQTAHEFISTVLLFPRTPLLSESDFERHLWALLQSLSEADREQFAWDPQMSPDPRSANFAMSLGGTAYFIVGLHPGAARLARRAPLAAVAFNPHSQFRRLRENGLYERLKEVVRQRDIDLQGEPNPMLADHGETSEAAQYSGRQVGADWRCPFHPHSGKKS